MFRKLRFRIIIIGCLLSVLLLQRCANVVAPTGGPKDELPPVVVGTTPENHSVNFNSKRIDITFDEYITLENAKQKVIFSPLLDEKADIKLKDQTVVIKFNEPLKTNTTYTINFGDAIKDLHEGNVFQDYVFSFSTGEVLDTLSIAGRLLSADEKKPIEDAFVTLYHGDSEGLDTLPLTRKPDFVGKVDKEGYFNISGLADKKYFVFAIKDVNSNYYFDLPNEQVAFLDTLVSPVPFKPLPKHNADSTMKQNADTLQQLSVLPDSTESVIFDTISGKTFDLKARDLTLYMFTEKDTTQTLLEKKLVENGLLRFAFRQPAENVMIETPEILPDSFNIVKVHSADFDTISWYFTPKVKDSLWVQIKYDTLIDDSTHYNLVFKEKKGQKAETLKISDNLVNNSIMPDNVLTLAFGEPLLDFQLPDSVLFIADKDTLNEKPIFEKADEFGFRYKLKNTLEADKEYSIAIPDSVLFSIRQRTNAALNLKFHLAKEDEYGNIFITVVPPDNVPQVIVQLLNDKNKIVDTQIITEKQEVEFWYLAPGKYKLKAILDADANGKWSTGNFHRHFLPETIIDYKDELDLKAGWDIDLKDEWKL
ncbi:MAG: Ig-like domain-containing protein [Bacteroidales bacterium]|nr:Ig-like domain-containing protein [Bacteroidales bacterium]